VHNIKELQKQCQAKLVRHSPSAVQLILTGDLGPSHCRQVIAHGLSAPPHVNLSLTARATIHNDWQPICQSAFGRTLIDSVDGFLAVLFIFTERHWRIMRWINPRFYLYYHATLATTVSSTTTTLFSPASSLPIRLSFYSISRRDHFLRPESINTVINCVCIRYFRRG